MTDKSFETCLKRQVTSGHDHDQPTLCQPSSVEHGVICAYMTVAPDETLAQVQERLAKSNEKSLDSEKATICEKCVEVMQKAEASGWRYEFGSEFAVPAEIENLFDTGILTDSSWHNDVCPSFSLAVCEQVVLWVDHPDPAQREMQGTRYLIVGNDDRMLATDDLAEVLNALQVTITVTGAEPRSPDELSAKTRQRIREALSKYIKNNSGRE
jgi:phage FluMu gp28-like protein